MVSCDQLQDRFVSTELAALGYSGVGQVLQPAIPMSTGNDQSLWTFFNAIPSDSLRYLPGDEQFFIAYSAMINALIPGDNPLDPIATAQRRLLNWENKPPTWNAGYARLKVQLSAAPSLKFWFSSDAAPDEGFWGLWGDSPLVAGPSAKFASGNVSADISFSKALSFSPTPGDWYVSSAMSLAYAAQHGRPWDPASPINWQTIFGPNGSMPRFLTSLLVVSGIKVTYKSSALFSADDQKVIRQNEAAGLWPYYLGADDASTNIQFDTTGRMTVNITSEENEPIIITASVLTSAQFLGR